MPEDAGPVPVAPGQPRSELGAHVRTPARTPRPPRRVRRVTVGLERYGILLVWLGLAAIFAVDTPNLFLTTGTFKTIFGGQDQLVFLSAGLVAVLAVGEFDLSVAALLGLSATLIPVLVVQDHWNLVLAVIFAVSASTAAGFANGLLVVKVGIDPIVVTLGTSTLLEGICLQQTKLSTVTGLPSSFGNLVADQVLGLPVAFFYGVVLVIVLTYVMFATRTGRHMRFVGANREVARLAGVRVNRIRLGAYTFSGFICGLGGAILVARLGGYDPTTSTSYLLPTFAATFLGSAAILPGRFNAVGAWLSIYFLETGIVGLELLGYTGWVSDVFFGGALIIAVALSRTVRSNRA